MAMEYFSFILLKIGIPVLVVFGVIGNALSAIVFCQKRMFSSFTLFLTCLAVADSLFLICRFWIFQNYYATFKLVYFISFIAQTCSSYLTVAISWERYQAICHPLSFGCCTIKRAIRLSLAVLLACILINIPEILYTAYDFAIPEPWFIAYLCFETVFKLLIPLILLGVFNVPICIQIRKLSTDPLEGKNQIGTQKKSSKDSVLLVVVALFAFCYVPFLVYTIQQLYNILTRVTPPPAVSSTTTNFTCTMNCEAEAEEKLSDPEDNDESYFWIWLKFTTTLNSSVNFIIYFFMGTKFRRALTSWVKAVIWRKRHRSASIPTGSGVILRSNDNNINCDEQVQVTETESI